MIPRLSGRSIRVKIRASLGKHWAATHIRKRLIELDSEVLRDRGEFERILIHELFHFVWVRLGNTARRDWEKILIQERIRRAGGELGWSAELRKKRLTATQVRSRSLLWRNYACESFCDTAAWLYAGGAHEEFTLPKAERSRRARWFQTRFREGAAL